MNNHIDKSAFYHFGILPSVCIYTIKEDKYSKMYKVRDKCECGCSEWMPSTMIIHKLLPLKDIHRCKNCNEIRLCDHIGIIDN